MDHRHHPHSHFISQHQHQHQQARYAPLPSHHPRHPQFPEEATFHSHNPPLHLLPSQPPAPTLPPPPPASHRVIHNPPPPQPYNPPPPPLQSPFSFNSPNYAHQGHHRFEEGRPISTNRHHEFSHSQRVSNRMLVDNDLPRHNFPEFDHRNPENRIGAWNPPRVLADNRPSRSYAPPDFDRELHQRPSDHPKSMSPYPPIDKLRYDSEGNSRLRMEHIDGYESNTRDEFVWGRGDGNYHRRGDFALSHDANSGEFRNWTSQSPVPRGIDSRSGSFVDRYGLGCDNELARGSRRDGRGDSKRWVIDRIASRDVHDSTFEFGNNEISAGAGDGDRIMSGKREYYGSEQGRYNNRGNRDGSHEYTRTPKKQIQKKSALLRIQTIRPNHRNREAEQVHYTNYGNDSNTNSFRGKDQHGYSGYGTKAEGRETSPVELDISFKSNSLVAKAILTPSSSAIVSDTDVTLASEAALTPAEKKEALVRDSDCSDLQAGKLSIGAVNLTSSPSIANDSSRSGKDLNMQKNASDRRSKPGPSAICNPNGKNEAVQSPRAIVSDRITKTCSGKASPRVAKKKKIVKKVMKKVYGNPNLHVSNSLSGKKHDGTMQAHTLAVGPSVSSGTDKIETPLKFTTADKLTMPDCLHPFSNEGNVLPENRKDVAPLSVELNSRSQHCSTNKNSDVGPVARTGSADISSSPSSASFEKDKKSDSDLLDADNSVCGLQIMPNTDKITKSLDECTSSDISNMDDGEKQFYQNEVSLSPGRYSNVGYSENRYHIGDNMRGRLSSAGDIVTSTDLINKCGGGLSSNDLVGKSREIINISDSGFVDEPCSEDKVPTVTESAILEENPISVPSCSIVDLPTSGNAMIKNSECPQHMEEAVQGSGNGSTNSEDNITVSSSGILNGAEKQVSPNDVTISPENCSKEGFPNSEISVGFHEGEAKIKKRKVRTHLDFSSLEEGISPEPVNSDSLANVVDTTSNLPYKVPGPLEVSDTAVQRLDFNLRSNIDGAAVLHGEKGALEAEVYVGNDGNNPLSKREKVTASYPNFIPGQFEFSYRTMVPTSCAEVDVNIDDNQAHQKEVKMSSMSSLSTTSMTYSEDRTNLPGNRLNRGVFESMVANRETVSSNPFELQHGMASDSVIPNVQSPFPIMEGERKENDTEIVPTHNSQMDILLIGNIKGENMDIQAAEEKIMSSIETPLCIDSSEHQFRDFVQISPTADMDSDGLTVKGDLPTEENCLSCPTDGGGVTTSNLNDELTEAVPDALLDLCSPGITSETPNIGISDCQPIHDDNTGGDEENLDSKSMDGSDLPACSLSAPHIIKDMKSDHVTECNNSTVGNTTPQPTQVNSRITTQGLKSSCSQLNEGKHQPGRVNTTNFQGHSSFVIPTSSTSKSSTQASKARTWHRTGSSSTSSLSGNKRPVGAFPPKRPIPERKGNFQNTAYIRKGNSLVRKLPPVAAFPQGFSVTQSPSFGLDEFHKGTRSESRVDITDQTNVMKTGVTNDPLERQRSPPQSTVTKLSNFRVILLEENTSSPLTEHPSYGCCESTSDAKKMIETNDSPNSTEDMLQCSKSPENQTGPSNNESQIETIDGNVSSLNAKKIVYVKRKSNQLVATSNPCDISVAADDKGQTASSDSYYKRKKNQLVRTTLESHINQTVALPKGTANSDQKGPCKVVCNRRLSKRRSLKVSGMSRKPWRASLVWTLCGTSSTKDDSDLVHHQKILPPLFPWKRATYLRSFIYNAASSSNSNSLSAISKKLLLLRKRDTVYIRSTHGLSLRKSKVLGVGGSSLKWSKSIEKRSKKANEEATLAVAAAERKKREQKDAACISTRAKRERIFRIGSVRYRMDSSRRTLQRISDDGSVSSTSIEPGSDAKRSYIPRRLVIGNDEYVRIGNGNQLVRDPKKRTRILANEKVRWSLHTARQRLARKQKYCQFFTRFGKCNKDDGKCPYIHDPSKIAVCTKFLNGLCSIPDCKLTHKIIPERMPDCSYFLQGSCTNRNCPYRHVNVNPKASICEGFLRGYCADGNECRKKHSYVCPTFEATGTCTQGTKCKLHHPKSKGKKRKRSGDQKNSRGRYFGSVTADVSEPGMTVAPRQCQQNDDDMEGDIANYISLDFSDEEVLERVGQSSEQATLCDSDPMDLQLDSLDELIKPVLIMKKNFSKQSSPGLQATV